MNKEYDFIIVGSGHNGLTCAAYLAKANQKVVVFEKWKNIGGGASTEEVTLPGFKHNLHSIMHAWIFNGPVYYDLELEKYGAKYILLDPPYGTVFKDGRSIICYSDPELTAKQIEKFSKRDAKTYRDFNNKYSELIKIIFKSFFAPPLPPSATYAPFEGTYEGRELLSMMVESPRRVCDEFFESEQVKIWIMFFATQIGNFQDTPGTGMVVPVLFTSFHFKPYMLAVGGSRMLAEAMAKLIEENGGNVYKNSPIEKIIVEDGKAVGVKLSNGETIRAKRGVISNSNPPHTFLELVGEEHLEESFTRKVKAFRPDEYSLYTLHVAQNEPTYWKAADTNPDINRCFCVGFGAENLDELESEFIDIRQGIPPRNKGCVVCHPTIYDPSQAPPGKHISTFYLYGVYDLKEGPEQWDKIKESYSKEVIDVWKTYTKNIEDKDILATHLHTPLDITRMNPAMFKGSIMHGSVSPDQMGFFRPFANWSNYRTPIRGLYMCGSSNHPFGGITAGPGYNAVNIVAEDFNIRKWWEK
jgi:phytoene dehydrogenase-like protein